MPRRLMRRETWFLPERNIRTIIYKAIEASKGGDPKKAHTWNIKLMGKYCQRADLSEPARLRASNTITNLQGQIDL